MSAEPPDPNIKESPDLSKGRIIAKEILGYENPKIRNVSDQTMYELASEPEICKTDLGLILDTKCAAHQYIASLSLSSLSAAIKNDIQTVMGVNIDDAKLEFLDTKAPNLLNNPYYLIFKYDKKNIFVDYYNKKKSKTLKVGYYRIKGNSPQEVISSVNKTFGLDNVEIILPSKITKIDNPSSFFNKDILIFNYDHDKKEFFTEYYSTKDISYYRIKGNSPTEIIKLFNLTF